MKKSKFLIVATAIFMVACSQSNDYFPENLEAKSGRNPIFIKFGTPSRAVGTPVFATETQITNGAAFVFNGSDPTSILDGSTTFGAINPATDSIKVGTTQGNRFLYLVTNVTDLSAFDAITTIQDLYNVAEDSKANLENLSGVALPMSGVSQSFSTIGTSIENPITITVPITFILSTIRVTWTTPQSGSFSDLSVDSVMILNAKQKSDYFSAANTLLTANVSDYYHGIPDVTPFTSGSYFPASPSVTSYQSFLLENGTTNGTNYFYLFENGINSPTIITLKASISGTTYYYPVVINGPLNDDTSDSDGSKFLRRGNIYNVAINITGPGVQNPYEELAPGCVSVIVTTQAWVPKNITQEF